MRATSLKAKRLLLTVVTFFLLLLVGSTYVLSPFPRNESETIYLPKRFTASINTGFEVQGKNQYSAFSTAFVLRNLGLNVKGAEVYEKIPYKIPASGYVSPKGIVTYIQSQGYKPSIIRGHHYSFDFGSGIGSLLIAINLGEQTNNIYYIIWALILGFFAYGLSIFFYIYAQRDLGAAKTSAYYTVAPFIGVGLSLIIFRELPTVSFVLALAIMIFGMYFASTEERNHKHTHVSITHEHVHSHNDGHHNHVHEKYITGKHSHTHMHEELTHLHKHTQDIHHVHAH